MKTLQELQALRDELLEAYNTVLTNEHTNYDNATIQYAKKCADDAEIAYQKALDINEEN